MSIKIYDAYRINSDKRSSVKTLIDIANYSRNLATDKFVTVFSKAALIRMFEAIDLVSYYGNDAINMDKYRNDYIKDLVSHYLDIKTRYSNMTDMEQFEFFWSWAVHSIAESVKYINDKFHASHHEAELVFIPCDNKMLVMYFGDPTYRSVIEDDHEHYADYHYQNQCDRPERITDEEWEQRSKDWEKAIGPDYVPARHGLTFSLVDYDSIDASTAVDMNFKKAYEMLDDIAEQRISNLFGSIQCPLLATNEEVPIDELACKANMILESAEYKAWKEETVSRIKSKIGITK